MKAFGADPRAFDALAMPPARRAVRRSLSPLGSEERPVRLLDARVCFRHTEPATTRRLTVDARATKPLQRHDAQVLMLPPHVCGSVVVSGNCLPRHLYVRLSAAGILLDTAPTPTLDGQTYRGFARFDTLAYTRRFPVYLRVDAAARRIDVFTCADRDDPPVSMQLTLSFADLGVGDAPLVVQRATHAFTDGAVVEWF
jgi:hypothetical protein